MKWRERTLESGRIKDVFDMFSTASQQWNIPALTLLIFQKMTFKWESVNTTNRNDTLHLTFAFIWNYSAKQPALRTEESLYLCITQRNNIALHPTIWSNPQPISRALWCAFFSPSSSSPFSSSSSPWLSEMELPLTFKDSSRKVIIELLPAVCRQEIGKWHMGPGTK